MIPVAYLPRIQAIDIPDRRYRTLVLIFSLRFACDNLLDVVKFAIYQLALKCQGRGAFTASIGAPNALGRGNEMKRCIWRRHGGLRCGTVLLNFGIAADWQAAMAQTVPADQVRSDKIQDIVVTAKHRTTSAQKLATSISVRSGALLRQRGRYTLAQILKGVPGVSGGGTSAPGGTAQSTYGNYGGAGSSYDIERVEILPSANITIADGRTFGVPLREDF
jgi:hypothetical protein